MFTFTMICTTFRSPLEHVEHVAVSNSAGRQHHSAAVSHQCRHPRIQQAYLPCDPSWYDTFLLYGSAKLFFPKQNNKIHQNSRSPKLQLKLFIIMGHSVIIPFAKIVSFQEKHLSWQIYNVDDIHLYYDIWRFVKMSAPGFVDKSQFCACRLMFAFKKHDLPWWRENVEILRYIWKSF